MVKVRLLETAPPGLETVTGTESTELDRLASTVAVICVPLTNAVERGAPFHNAVAPGTKLIPLIVRMNVGTPDMAALGLRLVRMGACG